jgi:hypothetical protein
MNEMIQVKNGLYTIIITAADGSSTIPINNFPGAEGTNIGPGTLTRMA